MINVIDHILNIRYDYYARRKSDEPYYLNEEERTELKSEYKKLKDIIIDMQSYDICHPMELTARLRL